MMESSQHPAHLVDSSGNLTPGALIPFCAYARNLSTLGRRIAGLDFPVCDKFQPTILDGQVCYVLNVEAANPLLQGTTENGMEKGLLLALHMNADLEGEDSDAKEEWVNKDIFETEASDLGNTAIVHLTTLDRFSITKPGKYAMASLKKMTGTSDFLDLSDNVKDCQIEAQERCYNRRYIEELQNQCNCLPWSLGVGITQKVTTSRACGYNIDLNNISQNVSFCGPDADFCIENVGKHPPDCRISCTGLYAVVWYPDNDNDPKRGRYGQKFVQMTSEYHQYLNNYAENLVYNSTSGSLSETFLKISKTFVFSFSLAQRVSSIALGPDLLCPRQLRRD